MARNFMTGMPKMPKPLGRGGNGGRPGGGGGGPVTAPETPQVPGVNVIPQPAVFDRQLDQQRGLGALPPVTPNSAMLMAGNQRNKLATAIPTDPAKMQGMLGKAGKGGMSSTAVNGLPEDKWRALMQSFGVFDQ